MRFIQEVIMWCDPIEYRENIRSHLFDIGYTESPYMNPNEIRFITNNYQGKNGVIGSYDSPTMKLSSIFIENNPELFIALASMTDEITGINGECFICTSHNNIDFQYGDIVKKIFTSHVGNLIIAENIITKTHGKFFTQKEFEKIRD